MNLWLDPKLDLSNFEVHAFDKSEQALQKAKQNAASIHHNNFHFYNSTVDEFP